MDPFIQKVKTQGEKDRLVQEAAAQWDQAGEFTHLLGDDQQAYLDGVANSIEVEGELYVAPRALTSAERNEQDTDLLLARMRYNVHPHENLPPALRAMAEADDAAELQKMLAPAVRERNEVESIIRRAIEKALTKATGVQRETVSIPTRAAPERQTIFVKLADRAQEEDADSLLGKWLRGYIDGDEPAMRRVARQLV